MSSDHALALLDRMIRMGASCKRSRTDFLPFAGPWPGVQGEDVPSSVGGDASPCRFEGHPGDLWANGWGFYLSRHALDALDIVYTTFTRTENALDEQGKPIPMLDEHGEPVMKNGRSQCKKVTHHTAHWTQGTAFRFTRGMMLYNAMIPEGEPWQKSLQRIRRGIQVQEAQPAVPTRDGEPRNPGMVKARLYLISPNRDKLLPGPEFTTTQDGFVRTLITGEVADGLR